MATEIIFQNKYRFTWKDKVNGQIYRGSWLFNDPSDAKLIYGIMKIFFPNIDLWLEDHSGNKVEIK